MNASVDEAQWDAIYHFQKELETLLMYEGELVRKEACLRMCSLHCTFYALQQLMRFLLRRVVIQESLDVIHERWDTTQWDFGDEVLESVVKNRSEMLAEEPFLHESLMLEREEGLSEEEKKEAELWFTREQYKDSITLPLNDAPTFDSGEHFGGYSRASRGFPHWIGTPRFKYVSFIPDELLDSSEILCSPMMDPPPLRSTPIPHQLDRVPMSLAGFVFQESRFALPAFIAVRLLFRNGGYPMGYPQPGGEMSNGNERGMFGPSRMFNPMEGPRRVPPFPGAAMAFEPSSNSRGSIQLIRTDRVLSLPVVSHPSETREIPANTDAMLVRSADGLFLRLSNGLLLNAQNSVFDTVQHRMPPLITIPPDPPRPLRLPPPLNPVPDVIELD
ncbi:hypothetical protein COOONC_19246 [Cooperia oncophora]